MPQMINFGDNEFPNILPVATEQELLDFVNKGRAAGGADILEALLPSEPGNSNQCLIANALNFGCSVTPTATMHVEEARHAWVMTLPADLADDTERVSQIADALGVPVRSFGNGERGYFAPVLGPLPNYIGNAADAFDDGLAFTDFDRDNVAP